MTTRGEDLSDNPWGAPPIYVKRLIELRSALDVEEGDDAK